MHTICTLSLKGGAGKSTVVQSLAVCAVQHGQNTLIVELDPQGTQKNWSRRREAEHPRVVQTLPQSLDEVLSEAAEADTHWVFLDTPGHDSATAAAAAAQADLILVPCKIQSTKDFDSVMLTLAEANRVNKPAYVLMNQVPPNSPKLVRQKQLEVQREYEIAVLSKYLSRRADFEYCDELGLSAAEYNPKGEAAQEIFRLYSLIQSIFITLKPQERKPSEQFISHPVPSAVHTESLSIPEEAVMDGVQTSERVETNVHQLHEHRWSR
ncbi:MAG: AAA family ATPase [Pseudomonadales bacterium]